MHLPPSPYVRLNNLLAPGGQTPVLMMHIGEPQSHVPDFVAAAIHQRKDEFGIYPPIGGTPAFRDAVRQWCYRRYGIKNTETLGVLPTSGAREALFQIAICARMVHPEKKNPVILLPEPMYHVYHGAAMTAGAEIHPLPLTEDNGFIADFNAVPEEILQNTILAYLCSPNNPAGSVMDAKQMEAAADTAKRYNFQILSDECYSEIYRKKPPCGMIQIIKKRPELLPHVWIINSLSKRSSVPGLRVGFVISHPDLINIFLGLRHYGGAQIPAPLLHAAVKLIEDEKHVQQARAHYNRLFDVVADVFTAMGGKSHCRIPSAGMFLWLKTDNGENFAKRLWAHHAIKVMPGRYMCLPENSESKITRSTPGDDYVRIAIVHDETVLRPAMEKIAHFLLNP